MWPSNDKHEHNKEEEEASTIGTALGGDLL